jgi:hypothetical protein
MNKLIAIAAASIFAMAAFSSQAADVRKADELTAQERIELRQRADLLTARGVHGPAVSSDGYQDAHATKVKKTKKAKARKAVKQTS